MHAVVLGQTGDAGVLRYVEHPDPIVADGHTLVRLKAAALNWHDVLVRQGRYGSPLPHVPGADGAGVTADSGEEVVILPSLRWGSDESAPGAEWEILGDHSQGTYAEFVSVPTENLFPKPRSLDWAQAASLGVVGVTAFRALVSRAHLRAGDSVLILGAGGGVAPMAVAIAVALGAQPFVTSSSEAKITRSVSDGAGGGVLYTNESWPEDARALSPGGAGFDVVLDAVGTWPESIRALKRGGRLVVLGASRAQEAPIDVRSFYFGHYSILGTTLGSAHDFTGLLDLVATGSIAPPIIDREFPLAEAADAHRYLEAGTAFGKITLNIG